MDFKAQLAADMRVFHNPAEFATITGFYYDRTWYEVPVVLDHEAAAERQRGRRGESPGPDPPGARGGFFALKKKGAGGKTPSWSAPMKTPYPYLS